MNLKFCKLSFYVKIKNMKKETQSSKNRADSYERVANFFNSLMISFLFLLLACSIESLKARNVNN